jgi:uncharacterized protein YndB with AHSA1/START domain
MADFGKSRVTTPSDREIMITRSFDAPRALVFEAFTKPELLKRWLYGPEGHVLQVCELDLRVGGRLHFVWRLKDGRMMSMGGVYREFTPPRRIVNTELYDEDWTDGEALVTTEFAETAGRTTVTMTILYRTREARDTALKLGVAAVEMGYARLDVIFPQLA